jgi:hypothetical protein
MVFISSGRALQIEIIDASKVISGALACDSGRKGDLHGHVFRQMGI